MANPKVFVYAPIDTTGESYLAIEDAGCELVYGKASWRTPQGDKDDVICAMAQGADALTGTSIRSSIINGKIMDAAPNLRIIAKCTIGVDDIDVEAATEKGILVTHAPTEANWSGVAEGTMAIMLTLLKKTREKDAAIKRGEWRDPSLQGTHVGRRHDGYAGLTVGIIGLGRIGRQFAALLAPWRVRILAYDPYVEHSRFIHFDAERVDLSTLLKESDVVSLHVVVTKETHHMIGVEQLALMKKEAILINTSRGQIVKESALAEALQNAVIAAAGLDVFDDEPLAADSPLLQLGDKVLLSPHMVSSNIGTGLLKEGVVWANRSILDALDGKVPEHVYNKEVIPRWKERFGARKVKS